MACQKKIPPCLACVFSLTIHHLRAHFLLLPPQVVNSDPRTHGMVGFSSPKMREIHERDMEEYDTLGNSEKTIAILEDGWWPQTGGQTGRG